MAALAKAEEELGCSELDVFLLLDSDQDGILTDADVSQSIVGVLDESSDGAVTVAEFRTWLQRERAFWRVIMRGGSKW